MFTYPIGLINPKSGISPQIEWLFSNNYNDTSGNGYNLTNFGSTFTADRHSVANNAIDTNASENSIQIMSNAVGKIGFFASTPTIQSSG